MTRVVLMEDYLDHARSLACVKELAARVELHIHTDRAASESELVRRLKGAEVAITIRDRVRFPATVLAQLTSLRLLSVCCLLYTSPSPRDGLLSRMPSSA